jgi:hypothetical protein
MGRQIHQRAHAPPKLGNLESTTWVEADLKMKSRRLRLPIPFRVLIRGTKATDSLFSGLPITH